MSKDEKEKKLGNWCLEQIEFVLPETTFVSIYDWNSFSSFFFFYLPRFCHVSPPKKVVGLQCTVTKSDYY